MPNMRSKSVSCLTCKGTSYVIANLDSGKLHSVAIDSACHWPAKCHEEFVRGVFDRPMGSKIIRPKWGAPT